MIVTCPNCQTKYNLPEDRIPAGGTKVKCSRCSHVFKADPPAPEDEVENLLEEEQAAPKESAQQPADDPDKAFDEAFDEMAGGEEPEEHGGDTFADDDMPEGDFDSLFDEPSGDDKADDGSGAGDGEDLDDLFGDAEPDPAAEPQPAADTAAGDELGDLFGDDDDAPAAAPEDDTSDVDDLFGDDDKAAEGDQLEGGLFDDADDTEEDLFAEADDEEDAEEADEDFDTDFDLDDEEDAKSGKGKWIALIVILLLVAAIGAGWYFKAWKFFGINPAETFKDVPVVGSLFGDAESDEPLSQEDKIRNIELKNVRQYYVQNEKAGLVFVVQGQAINAFDAPRERIEVEVFLYDANGNVLTSQRVMCGNQLSMFQLRVQSQQEIEEGLSSEVGILSNNTFLRPGASTPFMAAIFNAPVDKVKEFGVKVVDVQKPE
ncbi:DUF3426 domain-containing protein [Salidesulfovibrio brasiliensis]|uniref:DUF3426 domain-containing protein n=1 Tax=Salidesulfovibrio brasiliensis TaxID=221711 RepID=UPI0006D210B0|nr:DUF3426 domain-containing protein [Salidesulfovibrio brasiliensis]